MKSGEPGWFLPPFRQGWTYELITYGGHSDGAIDCNRRTPEGGWLQDVGNPVFAAWDGTVAKIDLSQGGVWITHYGGFWQTEYLHMTDIAVKKGQKVTINTRIGRIGGVNNIPGDYSPHLHFKTLKRENMKDAFVATKTYFEGRPIRTSVMDSDSKNRDTWDAPRPVYVVGPDRSPVETQPLYIETYNETVNAALNALNLIILNPNWIGGPRPAEIAAYDDSMAQMRASLTAMLIEPLPKP
jgi:hypothetical protein